MYVNIFYFFFVLMDYFQIQKDLKECKDRHDQQFK